MKVREANKGKLEVIPPSFRMDISREVDLFEEIARLNGYENIPTTLPYIRPSEEEEAVELEMEQKLKEIMVGMGYTEIITYSFISPEHKKLIGIPGDFIKIINPLTKDQSVMRTSLVPGMLETIKTNINYGEPNLRLFEIGKLFLNNEGGVKEKLSLCAGITGLYEKKTWYSKERKADFYDIKGAAETLLKSISPKSFSFKRDVPPSWYEEEEFCVVESQGKRLGQMGKVAEKVLSALDIEQDIYLMEIDLDSVVNYFLEPTRFKPFSRFPAVYRDISVIVKKEVESRQIEEIIKEIGGNIVESVHLFDLYEGGKIDPSEKALGFRIWFRSMKGTLEKKEVDKIYERMIKEILEKTEGRLREA